MGEQYVLERPAGKREACMPAIIAGIVFVIALIPRLLGLGTFLSPDESLWFGRSIAFWDALQSGQPAQTYQQVHPNVTTMWITGFILKLAGRMGLSLADPHWIPIARLSIVLVTSSSCAAIALALSRLLDRTTGLVAGLLLALDPFYLAHSRTLHMHSASAGYITLAWVTLLLACRHRSMRRIVLAGAIAGWALITNVNAVILLPMAGLVLIFPPHLIRRLSSWRHIPDGVHLRLGSLLLWGIVACATAFALWPALWVQPVRTLGFVATGARWGAEVPHGGDPGMAIDALYESNPRAIEVVNAYRQAGIFSRPRSYFMGRVVWTPGLLFYPLIWLYRSTPLTLLCVLLALATLGSRILRRSLTERDLVAAFILLLAVGMMTMLAVSSKQFQRYLQPVFLLLDILAAIYFIDGLRRLFRARGPRRGEIMTTLSAVTLLIGLHWLPYVHTHPYEIAYYQPLLGGHRMAQHIFQLGFGEGLDQVAAYLNDRYDGRPTVASRYAQYLAPFYSGETIELTHGDRYEDIQSDYIAVYITELQRKESPELDTLLAGREPEHVVTVNGIEYVWLYRR
jgi:hypothetical protein